MPWPQTLFEFIAQASVQSGTHVSEVIGVSEADGVVGVGVVTRGVSGAGAVGVSGGTVIGVSTTGGVVGWQAAKIIESSPTIRIFFIHSPQQVTAQAALQATKSSLHVDVQRGTR